MANTIWRLVQTGFPMNAVGKKKEKTPSLIFYSDKIRRKWLFQSSPYLRRVLASELFRGKFINCQKLLDFVLEWKSPALNALFGAQISVSLSNQIAFFFQSQFLRRCMKYRFWKEFFSIIDVLNLPCWFQNTTRITSLLLKRGANPNLTDSLGRTPLHVAVLSQNMPVFKMLLESQQ